MSHLTPQITHKYEQVQQAIQTSVEGWDRWLRTAERDQIRSAEQALAGLHTSIRNLRKDLEVEATYAAEGEVP